MKKQLVAIDIKKVSAASVIMAVLTAAPALAVSVALRGGATFKFWVWDFLICLTGYIALIILHELTHGLAHLMCGLKPSEIKFGIMPKVMAAYCYGKKPLAAGKFRFVLIIPVIVTGIIPLIAAVFYLNILYIVLFSAMVAGAAGDFAMLWKLRRYPRSQMIMDHPSAPAFYLIYDEDKLPPDFIEVTEEQEKELKNSVKGVKEFSRKR